MIVWTDSLISGLKTIGNEDWPIAHSARALNGLFRTIPKYAEVRILLESDDVLAALLECEDMERRHPDLVANVNSFQQREFLSTRQNKRIHGTYRKFEASEDADVVGMRMVPIWEAHETMERAVAERDHPLGFLA